MNSPPPVNTVAEVIVCRRKWKIPTDAPLTKEILQKNQAQMGGAQQDGGAQTTAGRTGQREIVMTEAQRRDTGDGLSTVVAEGRRTLPDRSVR